MEELKEAGVDLEACVTCAKRYGVVSELEELGVDVYGMGKLLTDYLKGRQR
ncbi:MAG: DsrE family protein [Candidatus Bipolaricaulia bacterium]